MIKKKIRWAGHVARVGEMGSGHKTLVLRVVDGRITLKRIFKK
jgi:hypothetical protein